MSLVLRRSYLKANSLLSSSFPLPNYFFPFSSRSSSDDKSKNLEFINSTILIENGFNVQELPVIVRKLTNVTDIEEKPEAKPVSTQDSISYHLIQAEFKQCVDLRDVFSLLSKCTKITPNIALGAMERIYHLESDPAALNIDTKHMNTNLAKGAILDKLLKVVMKTEDTQTILNVLKSVSTFMEPYKYKFCDELLLRVIDNKVTIEQLCEFVTFLVKNKSDPKYCETIDKLWVGFVEKEGDIDETNIVQMFTILNGLKASKRIILTLLEQKLSDLWPKIGVIVMQDILNTFIQEKYLSFQSFAVVGRWLNTNIHALDEDSFLDIITKLTRLKYTDDQVEKAVEKYMKLKGSRIESYILIVGILNYCMQFQIRNTLILEECSQYFSKKGHNIPPSFMKSFIYPYGYLHFNPKVPSFWEHIEKSLNEKFDRINTDDFCSIILSYIYMDKYPLQLVSKILSPEYLVKVNNPETMRRLHLIDTSLSLECPQYSGPLLPKDQCSKPILQDKRIKNIIDKLMNTIITVVGGSDKFSTAVFIPNICSDETYLIDIMIHPPSVGTNMYNWKSKLNKNENIAILIHLPDHYCSDNEHLIGPQVMRQKHLQMLGLKVVSLKYSMLSQFYTSHNTTGLKEYLSDNINNAKPIV